MGLRHVFHLKQNNFDTSIREVFIDLREDDDFYDVTLACDDDGQIQAHKIILSACSPFFRAILKRNRHEHPLLFLKGVKHAQLVKVLDFVYYGEVEVAAEELNTFLAVAEDLNVKGLSQKDVLSNPRNETETFTSNTRQVTNSLPVRSERSIDDSSSVLATKQYTYSYKPQDEEIQEIVPLMPESVSCSEQPSPLCEENPTDKRMKFIEDIDDDETNEKIYSNENDEALRNSAMDKDEWNKELGELVKQKMTVEVAEDEGKVHHCKTCDFTAQVNSNLRSHVEAKHFIDRKYYCICCEETKKTWQTLLVHLKRDHNVLKYSLTKSYKKA